MIRRRSLAAALALSAALAAAGCGFGPGDEVGEVTLTVTRDYGARAVVGPLRESVRESDSVMRLLDREVELSTRYGGGFVSAIDGLAEAARGGRRFDWFFFVDGVESPVGAAEYGLKGGEAVWWDYRDWRAAQRVPAVVGSFPRPLAGGYGGEQRPVTLECLAGQTGRAACDEAERKLRAAGVEFSEGGGAIRVLVGPWGRVREDLAARQIERGPASSGVFATFEPIGDGGYAMYGLDVEGERARRFGPRAGLVAATRRFDAPPVWVVTGAGAAGALAAARLLDVASLRDRYAVAGEGDAATPLPLPEEGAP